MNKTMIINATGVIKNPPEDAPKFPDITTGLIVDWNASDLSSIYSDGQPVLSWVGRGDINPMARTLDSVVSGRDRPIFKQSGGSLGRGSVTFSGNSNLRTNQLIPSDFLTIPEYTIAVVLSDYKGSGSLNYTRIFGGATASGGRASTDAIRVNPATNDAELMPASGANALHIDRSDFVVVGSFKIGGGYLGMTGYDPIRITSSAAPSGFMGASLGTSRGTISGDDTLGISADYSRVIVFNRPLSEIDVKALVYSLSNEYRIS